MKWSLAGGGTLAKGIAKGSGMASFLTVLFKSGGGEKDFFFYRVLRGGGRVRMASCLILLV